MEAKLVLVRDDGKPGEFQLKLPTTVGRSKEAGLTVIHPLVSRQHCELFEVDGQLRVRDLGSTNGTFVGDRRVTAEAALPAGELLTVGSVTFRAVYGSGAAAATISSKNDIDDGTLPAVSSTVIFDETRKTGTLPKDDKTRPAPPFKQSAKPQTAVNDDDDDFELRLEDDEPPKSASKESKPSAPPAAATPPDDDFELDFLDDDSPRTAQPPSKPAAKSPTKPQAKPPGKPAAQPPANDKDGPKPGPAKPAMPEKPAKPKPDDDDDFLKELGLE